MKSVIFAAGEGKRLGAAIPKPAVAVLDVPMIAQVCRKIRNVFKDSEIIVVVSPGRVEYFTELLKDFPGIKFAVQEQPLGTANALGAALETLGEDDDLLILYADLVLIREASIAGMTNLHELKGASVTFLSGITRKLYPYALVERNREDRVLRLSERKTPDFPAPWEYLIGPMIKNSAVARKYLPRVKANPETGEYYLPELVNYIIDNDYRVESFRTLDESEYLGVNTPDDLKNAEEVLLMREVEAQKIREERYISFGTGGWRARIGSGFTSRNVRRVVNAISNYVIENDMAGRGIVIGYDNRFLSEEFSSLAAEVLAANNIKVYLSKDSLPTPLVTFTVLQKKAAGGIMFTASHNPPDYNGIKFETCEGLPAPVEVTDKIQEIANSVDSNRIPWVSIDKAMDSGYVVTENFRNDYLDNLEEKIDYDKIKKANLRVCFDPMYGSGTSTLQMALMGARCEVVTIHSKRDPLFGGKSPAPSEGALSSLIQFMKENEFDIGIAVDGDADRIALIDEKGNYLPANEIMLIIYHYLVGFKKLTGGVVRNISTSHNIDLLCRYYGQDLIEVPVGFKHIANAMKERDLLMGGESSGGVTFRGHILEKDGVFTAMLILEMLAETGKTLSEIMTEINQIIGNRYYSVEISQKLTPSLKVVAEKFMRTNPEELAGKKITRIDRLDGVKYYLDDGSWILLRMSGTEPLLRLVSEAHNRDVATELTEKVARLFS